MVQKYVMLQMEDYQGDEVQKGMRGFTVVMCCEKRSSSVGVIMHFFLSSETGKTYLFKFCTDTCMLDIGSGYDGWVGWQARVWSLKDGKNMCHIYTHYLTWQRSVLTT